MARIAGMSDGNRMGWTALGVALAMLVGCSGEKPAASAPPPAMAAAAPTAPTAPTRPEGADAVDTALTDVQLFNATATESLIDIATDEATIRELAAKAVDLARRAENAAVAQRPGLAKSFAAALAEREAAHAKLAQSLESFRTTSAETGTVVETALIPCAASAPPTAAPVPTPGSLAAYPGCVTLATEQALLAANIAALSKAFESAEAAYRQDRRRTDEAAATMALVR